MSFSLDSISSGLGKVTDFVKNRIGDTLDPSKARLSIAGLAAGGRRATMQAPETRVGFSVGSRDGTTVPIENDWRVRVSVGESSGIFYKGEAGILAPLISTQGVVFPYTPNITTSYSANYSSQKTTHSNYAAYFYDSSDVQAINLSGDFTVQTVEEGQYLLACIYFFRSATKMFYGNGSNAGNPPPVLFLNGYGEHLFPNVPCILTSFTHTMGQDVDYLEVPSVTFDPMSMDASEKYPYEGSTTSGKSRMNRLPTISQIQISLQPIYSRKSVAEFDLDKFASGKLVGGGFI